MSDSVAMSFKARMKAISKEFNLRPQTVIQNCMFERFLERLSKSEFRDSFIIKGGLLISSMVGLKTRSTMDMDMDTTMVGLPMTLRSVKSSIRRIAAMDIGDETDISVLDAGRIKIEVEGYPGIRVKLEARFRGLRVPFAIDITKGDVITPDAIEYKMPCCFKEGESLLLKAYTIETILAEKCESILKRNVVGTRPRDYYDVYVLTRMQKFRKRIFRDALVATFANCGTTDLLEHKDQLLDAVLISADQQSYWKRYQREFAAAADVDFADAVESVRLLLSQVVV